jgi:AraC-like DNA-binding protein
MVIDVEGAPELVLVRDARSLAPRQNATNAMNQSLAFVPPFVVTPIIGSVVARRGLVLWQQRKIETYLRHNLMRRVCLDEMADEIFLSRSVFCRAFKETFGKTPHAYVNQLRLELAKSRMLMSDDSLSQIALLCGLADQAHLCKLFRRILGEAPNIWRRRALARIRAGVRTQR